MVESRGFLLSEGDPVWLGLSSKLQAGGMLAGVVIRWLPLVA